MKHRVEGFGTGAFPNPPDARDANYKFDPHRSFASLDDLPHTAGFPDFPGIYHRIQGGTPLCTVFALAHQVAQLELLAGLEPIPISVLQPHWWARFMAGEHRHVTGAYPRYQYRAFQKKGAGDEADWPFSGSTLKIIRKPGNRSDLRAWRRVGCTYHHLHYDTNAQLVMAIQAALAAPGTAKRNPTITAAIGSSFAKAWKQGHEIIPFRQPDEPIAGYHRLLVDAYRTTNRGLELRHLNSWSGQKYCWVPVSSYYQGDAFDGIICDGWLNVREKLS